MWYISFDILLRNNFLVCKVKFVAPARPEPVWMWSEPAELAPLYPVTLSLDSFTISLHTPKGKQLSQVFGKMG